MFNTNKKVLLSGLSENNPNGNIYFVRTDGDNANDGLTNNSSGAFLTIKHAESVAADLDWVYVSSGTYSEPTGVVFDKSVDWRALGPVTMDVGASTTYLLGLYMAAGKTSSFTGFSFLGIGADQTIFHNPSGGGQIIFNNCDIACDGVKLITSYENGLTLNNCRYAGAVSESAIDVRGTGITINGGRMSATVTGSSALFSMSDTGGTDTYSIRNVSIDSISFSRLYVLNADGNYDIGGNTLVSDSDMNALYYIGVGKTGSIEIYDEDYDLGGYCTGQFVKTNGANSFTWNIHGNNINISNVNVDEDVFFLRDQGQITFDDNIINTESEGTSRHLNISSTGSATGIPLIRNNTLLSKALVQHIVKIGDEDTTTGDNDFDGTVFTGNKVRGALSYDNLKVTSCHAVFLGHNINGNFSHNDVRGGAYGILFKSRANMTFASGGIHNNIVLNNSTSDIDVRGIQKVPIINNTVSRSNVSGNMGISVLNEPVSGSLGSNPIIKNNIIFGAVDFTAISISPEVFAAGFVCDNNCIWVNGGFKGIANGVTYTDFDLWKAAVGCLNSINADPDVDSKYSPQSGSPAIGAGEDLGSAYALQIAKDATFPDPDTVEQTGDWNMGAVA
jgi:hypothetical protein